MDAGIIGILLFAFLILLVIAGMPIAFAIGLSSLLGIWVFIGPNALSQLAVISYKFGTDPTLVLVPMFVVMAELLSKSGVAEQAFDAGSKWFSRLRGGLGATAAVAGMLFGACCGSSSGGTATIGLAAMPQLAKHRYDGGFAAGIIAAAGTLSIIIPPSAMFIIYGLLTEESIGKLFIAGILPGIITTTIFVIYILSYARFRPQDVEPSLSGVTWRDRFLSLKNIWVFILIALGVLGSIYAGICTPTESACVGAFLSLIVAALYRKLTWRSLRDVLFSAARISCFIIFILFSAFTFSYLLTYLGIPQLIAETIVKSGMSDTTFVILTMFIFLILGCLLDPAGILVLTLPTLVPVMRILNIDFIWYGVLVTMCMMIGNLTPPVGLNLFVMKTIAPHIPMRKIVMGTVPFVALIIVGMLIVFFFPQVATYLPDMMRN